MAGVSKTFPAYVPVKGRRNLVPEFKRPRVLRRMMWPFWMGHTMKKIIRAARLDEYSEDDLDKAFDAIRTEAMMDLEAQKVKRDIFNREILEESKVELFLLKSYIEEIDSEIDDLKEELEILDENTYEWSFK